MRYDTQTLIQCLAHAGDSGPLSYSASYFSAFCIDFIHHILGPYLHWKFSPCQLNPISCIRGILSILRVIPIPTSHQPRTMRYGSLMAREHLMMCRVCFDSLSTSFLTLL